MWTHLVPSHRAGEHASSCVMAVGAGAGEDRLGAISLRDAYLAELEEARESLTMWYQNPGLQKLPHLGPIPRTL